MAKKKKAKKIVRKPVTRKEYLGTLIRLSERAITGQGSGVDSFFTQQVDRLKKELESISK